MTDWCKLRSIPYVVGRAERQKYDNVYYVKKLKLKPW